MATLLLKPIQAADELQISRAKTYQLIAEGDLPAIKVGNDLRVPYQGLVSYVEKKLAEVAGTSPNATPTVERPHPRCNTAPEKKRRAAAPPNQSVDGSTETGR